MLIKERILLKLFCLLVFITALPALVAGADVKAYHNLTPGQFFASFLVTEPIEIQKDIKTEPSNDSQIIAFKNEPLPLQQILSSFPEKEIRIAGKQYKIREIKAKENCFDLVRQFGQKEFAYVYAYAEIDMDNELQTILGIGSDDGIKVWLNGQLVHENWIGRPLQIDEDLVPVHFVQGKNKLLIKIQNQKLDWGFSCRVLGPAFYQDKLVSSCYTGQLDAVRMLLENGADVNGKTESGLTPLQAAHIGGRQEVADSLLSQGADPETPMPAREQLVDYIFSSVIDKTNPGAAVLVAQNGEILYQKGFGMANREKDEPVTPESTFRIGSITKQFTATAILKLQEQGFLSIHDPLSKYIADFPRGDEVTLYHLLTHTSGIHSYTSMPDFIKKVKKPITEEELVQKIKKFNYDFNPGESWLYNNSGYFLLGYIIEKVSNMSYADYLKKIIFEPLQMTSTGVYDKGIPFAHEAIGYSYDGSVRKAIDWDMSHAGGAGSLYSDVIDLYKWNEGIFNGKILSEASFNSALTPAKLNNGTAVNSGEGQTYGFGWVLSSFRGLQEIGHGGGLDGFSTVIVRYPEKKMTIIVLTNCAPALPDVNPSLMARHIAEIYLWQEMEKQQSFSTKKQIAADVLDKYVGQYDYGRAIMTISRNGDHLYAQLPGQPQYEIFPKSENEFYWKVVDAQITFVSDSEGKVTHAIHQQNGSKLEARKLVEKPIAAVDPKIYQDYKGEYQLQPGAIITVSTEDDKLYIQVTGQPKLEIFPSSETEYFLKVVNAQIQFIRDADNKVNELKLFQNGMQFLAPRIK